MHRSACPFAAALFGSISGSAAGSAVGAMSGWLLYAAYSTSGGRDASGFALLAFGTLGMGVGGSGGAVGGMIEGWSMVEGPGPTEVSASKWGAILGGLWSLQPILWLAFTTDRATALSFGAGASAIVMSLGAISASLGGLAARSIVRALGIAGSSALPIRKNGR
ncbi:hypothetical protein P12x_002257 [Tundrisphaera lichenicola]|uniref:hypothetical protein n=1 Tax=Tundrisphaera lichenicola TaxID=2029860 RepID=UPI003EB6BB4B